MSTALKLKRTLLPFAKPGAIAGESLMLPLLAVGLGIWLNPLDPLWTHAAFPWVWFAPIILALRYGPFPGLAGAAVLLVAWFAFAMSGWLIGDFPKINFLGGLIFVMLCGEFSSLWLARTRRAEGIQLYLDQRMEYLTHQYYLLRLSHDRLEQDLIGRPMAMRDALATLQNIIKNDLGAAEAASPQLAAGNDLLRLLAQYCQFEAAVLHAIHDGCVDPVPVASIGLAPDAAPMDVADPLIQRAQESGQLSHVAHELDGLGNPSRYLVVAPLYTFDGEQLGILAVERIPLFALHEEMLQTLNLLLGYYTDGLVTHRLAAPIRAAIPDCPVDFAAELQRLWRVRQESEVGSVIVALEFLPHAQFDDLALQIQRQRRSLDLSWLIETAARKVLITLMPLAGSAAAEGYIVRIEQWVRRQGNQTLSEAGIFAHVVPVDEQPPLRVLDQLFEICHVPAETRTLRPGA